MSFFDTLNYMLVLVILFGIGVIAHKTGITDDVADKKISTVILMLSQSALILYSAMSAETELTPLELLKILALAFAAYGIMIVAGLLVPRVLHAPKKDHGIFNFMSIFSNVGFMGFPVIASIYGDGAVFYAAMFSMPLNMLAYTYGVVLVSGGEQKKIQWKSILNPPIISSVLAAFIFLFHIKFPTVIVQAADMLGSTLTPMAMLIIGGSMAELRMKDVLGDWRVYIMMIIRLFVLPFIVWVVMRNFLADPMLLGVCTLVFAMPVAAIATIFSIQYDGNVELASKTVFLTTVFSVISIPIVVSTLLL